MLGNFAVIGYAIVKKNGKYTVSHVMIAQLPYATYRWVEADNVSIIATTVIKCNNIVQVNDRQYSFKWQQWEKEKSFLQFTFLYLVMKLS